MSRFHYSDDEMDINKVLKMNQDISTSMIEDTNLKANHNFEEKCCGGIRLFPMDQRY